MHIHYLQHVPFEGLGSIQPQLLSLGHRISSTRLYDGEIPPPTSQIDALVILGGPMGVGDEHQYPWLKAEKIYISSTITDTSIPVLGICLGAQLLANALGGTVTRNSCREIGWFPLRLSPEFLASPWGGCLEQGSTVFHWHGDTFTLPPGTIPLGSSNACRNQGFAMGTRILGLQFHLETTPSNAHHLLNECASELDGSNYVQSANEILQVPDHYYENINNAMGQILQVWLSRS